MVRNIMLCIALVMTGVNVSATTSLKISCETKNLFASELTESQKVERLIQFIRGMKGATFVRNGSEHTCQEAADHLQSKWEKHRDHIKSAEEFIEELASRSGLTGQDYLVRFADGTELTTNEVLFKELKRLEEQ